VIAKLPRWVWTGTGILAFIAGFINVVGLLGFEHQTITHLTGNTTRLAQALAAGDRRGMILFASLIGSFVAGAVASGFLIQDSTLLLGRRYGVALLVESLLLFVSIPLLERKSLGGMCAAAGAIGLQNAMVTAYSGTVIRTSHVSGMFTDLGIYLGHAMRGLPINMKRLQLCLLVISAFLGGGVAGTIAFKAFDYSALLFPATLTAVVAIAYGLYRVAKRLKQDPSPLLSE
jgi:uncharacterized membrane protein YoaK (UPF0700 family)